MHIKIVLYILFIDFLAVLSPGPDFFMVLKNAMTISRTAGIYTALGIASGCIVLFAIGMFGIGELIAGNKGLFWLLKIAGGVYLTYIALKSVFAKINIEEPQLVYKTKNTAAMSSFYKTGLVCNLTNPKAFMFIVSLSTYAIAHGGNNLADISAIILGSGLAALLWFCIVSFIFGNYGVRKVFYQKQRIINLLFGAILLYIAAEIIII